MRNRYSTSRTRLSVSKTWTQSTVVLSLTGKKQISRNHIARCISIRRSFSHAISANQCAARCVRTSMKATQRPSLRTNTFLLARTMTTLSKLVSKSFKNSDRHKTALPKSKVRQMRKREPVITLDSSQPSSSLISKYT